MKKNVMMRLASFLLVAVLISTSAISGTYAKYVTEGTGTDKARVAHFGVTVYGDSDIFDAEYKTDDTTYTGELTVKAKTADNLVAPGTTKTMANVGIVGVPEVAVRISNDVKKFDIGENWVVENSFYCPLIITVVDAAGNTAYISGLDYTTAEGFEAAVIAKIETATADYAPLTDLSKLKNVLNITWQWAFEGATADSALSYGQTDEKDTALGDAANKGTVEIEVTTIVTQID